MSDAVTPPATPTADEAPIAGAVETPFRRFCRDYMESRIATVALAVLVAIYAAYVHAVAFKHEIKLFIRPGPFPGHGGHYAPSG